MTIDEAIAKHRKIVETQKMLYDACTLKEHNSHFLQYAEEHEQLAEWLEELKMLRELKDEHRKIGNIEGFNQGYDKAIDDFVKLVEIWCWKHEQYNQDDLNKLMNIAEQLKAGGENDNLRK